MRLPLPPVRGLACGDAEMSRLKRWWRDWRRGYTDEDLHRAISVAARAGKPGEFTFLSVGEMRALRTLRTVTVA